MSRQDAIRIKGNYFADPRYIHTDVTKGVTRTTSGLRICTLPAEFLSGLVEAVEYECGKSSKQILKAMGRRYGSLLIKRIDREVNTLYGCSIKELHYGVAHTIISNSFDFFGYGDINITSINEYDQVYYININDPVVVSTELGTENYEYFLSGLLCSIFTFLSDATLDSILLNSLSQGAQYTRYLIGSADLINTVEEWLSEQQQRPSEEEISRYILRCLKQEHLQMKAL